MKELIPYFNDADSKTLAIFDVDMVLVQPRNPAFQMPNMKRYGPIAKCIMKEIPPEKLMIFLCLMTISSDTILIDEHTPAFLHELCQRGIPTMALTANLTGIFSTVENMETWRVQSLLKLGIDFKKNAPWPSPLVFDHLPSFRGNYSNYIDGMLFVNGTPVSKGDAFLAFFNKTKLSYNKIIFVDDREENLKSVEDALQKLEAPITYQGIHYQGAQNYPSILLSEEEFAAQWQKLASLAKELE